MSDGGRLISTAYDTDQPDPDFEFDPIGWFESTGEDRGLPPDYVARYNKALAESKARQTAQSKESK